jgi:MoxR-like ATPase
MFNIFLDYPEYASEVEIVKSTTTDNEYLVQEVLNGEQIIQYQHLVRRVPIADNVVEYAVNLVHQTRPFTAKANKLADDYLEWGAGPRASQYLVLASKCHALLNGKYSPDIEDIQAVAKPILRHRIVRNFKAEAEDITLDNIIEQLL